MGSLFIANLSVKGMRVGEVVEIDDVVTAAAWMAKGWIQAYEPYQYVRPVVVEVDHPAVMHALLNGDPIDAPPVEVFVEVEGDGSGEALPPIPDGIDEDGAPTWQGEPHPPPLDEGPLRDTLAGTRAKPMPPWTRTDDGISED